MYLNHFLFLCFLSSSAFATEPLLPLFDAYGGVQTALANDELADAKASLITLNKAITALQKADLPKTTKYALPPFLKKIKPAINAATKAETIDSFRTHFETLSKAMIALHKEAPVSKYSEFRCPMAFDNKGASWLQASETTANPYFGSSMLRCGYQVKP